MLKQKLSSKATIVKKLQCTICLAFLFFLYGSAAVFTFKLSVILSIATLLLYVFFIFFVIKAWYKSYSYDLNNESIRIQKGVFISKDIVIFTNRIQYSDVIQTPLQKLFRTCTIIIHTAGAAVYLSEIDIEDHVLFDLPYTGDFGVKQ